METKILAIIPARGGSKTIPRKNIKLLNGKPLIYYTIKESIKSKYLGRIIVSTEDKEISEISKKYGAEVIERPEELAKDETPTIDVIFHVLQVVKALKLKTLNPEPLFCFNPLLHYAMHRI